MKDKHVIKNMEYWKKKNNIPGIEALEMAGLTDGRAKSSAFQMATPGSSPNKGWFGNAIKSVGQGLTGKGGLGFLNPGAWALRGIKNTLDNDPTTTNIFGGGGGGPAGGGALGTLLNGGGGAMTQDPAMAAVPVQTPMVMKKSPLEQEEPKSVAGQYLTPGKEENSYYDEEEDTTYMDPDGFVETDEEGFVVDNDYIINEENVIVGIKGDEANPSPSEENVPIGPMGAGGMDITGGVGGNVLQMQSPNKIYSKEDPEKY